MKERTVTATELESAPLSRDGKSAPGVVVVFQRRACIPVPHRITGPRRFGRDDTADVTMDDPALSRFHALLAPDGGGVRVTDLESRNGVFVGGVRIGKEAFAPYGSVIRMGRTLLLVVADVVPFELESENPFPALVGGPALADVRRRISTVAKLTAPVLVEGETGTGKELVARALHDASGRAGRFVGVNCAALAEELVESELFGHAKGSFSGSAGTRAGLFRTADGGTLLLDEIGELPLRLQAKLLRVIETGEVRSVGEDTDTSVDVRIVAATNRDLQEMVERGTFRADVLHRIAAARIHLPALHERPEDVPRLTAHFLAAEGLEPSVGLVELLLQRRWSGNVRELRHALTMAAAVAQKDGRNEARSEDVSFGDTPGESDPASMRTRLARALAAAEGNVTRAAQDVGMARSGFYEALRRLNLDPASFRRS